MQRLVVTFALQLAFFGTITAQFWFRDNTSTPFYTDSVCNTPNIRICDPERTLEGNTYELAQLIDSIQRLGKGCGDGPGYMVGVAIVKNLFPASSSLSAVEQIARQAYAKWRIGTCGEAIIIASAASPHNVVYVVTESLASSVLQSVNSILDSSRPYFAHSQKMGLQYLLIQIKSVLSQGSMLRPYPMVPPQRKAKTDGAQSVNWSGSLLFFSTLALVYRAF